MMGKMTIQDIARLAGVSKATVSRVLNNKPDVDPETRERVLRIMDEENFVPSPAATGLAGRSRMLGVLVPSLTWPLIPQIMHGIADVVEQTNYELVLYSISHARERAAVLDRILATKLTSGLLAIFPGPATQHVAELHDRGFPVVMIDDQGQPTRAPWIGAENHIGAYKATRHLLALGHRRIGFMHGPEHYLCARERYEGFCQALSEAGIAPDPDIIWQGDFEVHSGRACGAQILAHPHRPTAVFASNDQMAYGLVSLIEERGGRVPEDLAVIGFDDIPPLIHTHAALTTVRQPFFEMGQRGVQTLLDLIEAPRPLRPAFATRALAPGSSGSGVRIQLGTTLVVRESCGAKLAGAATIAADALHTTEATIAD
jgi:LacI family transcriptional regulator